MGHRSPRQSSPRAVADRNRQIGSHSAMPARHHPRSAELRRVFATLIGFAVLTTLSVFALTTPWRSGQWGTPSAERSGPPPPLFDSPVTPGLPSPGPATRVPVNSIDRFTGQPIIASSPTITYKGYVVAFCCIHSTGYTGGWDRLTEAEKDTYVRGFLK